MPNLVNEEQFPNLEDEVNQNGNRKDNGTCMMKEIITVQKIVSHLSTYINRKKASLKEKNINFFPLPTPWKKTLQKIFRAAHG